MAMIARIRSGLLALILSVCAIDGVHAQATSTTQTAQSASNDFSADHWGQITMTGEILAGVRGQSEGDLMLLACIERDRTVALSFHPADQAGLSETAKAILLFDGDTPVEAKMSGKKAVLNNILFLLLDRDPNFRPVMEKVMSSKTVEIEIVESGAAQKRRTFTLNGAAEAIAPALKLCGQ